MRPFKIGSVVKDIKDDLGHRWLITAEREESFTFSWNLDKNTSMAVPGHDVSSEILKAEMYFFAHADSGIDRVLNEI